MKLLNEKGEGEIWDQLVKMGEKDLLPYLNEVVINRLSENYGSEVISKTSIHNTATIKKIVTKLNPLNLTDVDEDIKGVAFEHFIQKTTDTQNDLGEYFTPRHIVRFMVRLLNPKFGESVYDPFCGTGGFLTESFKHISQQRTFSHASYEKLYKETVFGGEITTTARIAKMNMILYGDGHSGVTQQDSLQTNTAGRFDNILSNIPFSQSVTQDILDLVGGNVKDADEACIIRCFNSLKTGGSMAIVVPEGILVNRSHIELRRFLFQNSRVRLLVRLPRGCFAPYTDSKTGILYLTDKKTKRTDWFYRMTIKNDGFDSKRNPVKGINDLDNVLFFYTHSDKPEKNLPDGLDIGVVRVENAANETSFYLQEKWKVSDNTNYINLEDAAILKNGKSITEATITLGDIPVIAGGRGTSPYSHNEYNYSGNVFTISKSGAYSGYVWWHDNPIWASDSIVIKSKDESKFLTQYLYMCMKSKQDEIYNRQQGTGQPHIYIGHINNFPIPYISIKEQIAKFKSFKKAKARVKKAKSELSEYENKIKDYVKSRYKS